MSALDVAADAEAGLSLDSRLRLATSIAGVGVWEWRLDTNEFHYSEEAKTILGFRLNEPVSYEMVVAATHPDDLPHTLAQSIRARDPLIRDVAPYEYRVITPAGEE